MVDARASYDFGNRSSGEAHGVVLTKPHVVSLILDLAGYTPDKDLTGMRLLEPSCGHGAFLIEAVKRLLAARRGPGGLSDCICAFDIDPERIRITRSAVTSTLVDHGIPQLTAAALARNWIKRADFLLQPLAADFDCIVGNPPYVRIEQIPQQLQAEYRKRYTSLFDRADLYVAFFEKSLSVLSKNGVLSFICADRWMLNKYGAPLRALLTQQYCVQCYLDLHQASPFESEVIAYPAIFALSRGPTRAVRVAVLQHASPDECAELASELRKPRATKRVAVHDTWFKSDEPWVVSSPEQRAVLRRLEQQFAPITDTAKVGIGVATGNDKLYILDKDADIEPERLVPLIMREDLESTRAPTKYVINTFGPNGKLIQLSDYPRLRRYFERHASEIKRRHIAQRNPGAWFRTIDRVYPELARTPKLLIPDIAGSNEVVFESGHYYPHHNLYFVTSQRWDMEVLGGLLSSRVALFFVWSYAVKMRGGYLRFQAQYLRRIRLPDPDALEARLAREIKQAFRKRDFAVLDALALQAYALPALPAFDFVDTR